MLDEESCYRALQARDPRFDGWFYVGVVTTGIYCRPSCPARPPKRANVRFLPSAAAAHAAGFRACKRCRPDATPGSPEWNARGDVAARAMRLIHDGVVDRHGVGELARRLGYSERQLNRLLVAEVGAGPLALARAQRAQTARVLLETTDVPVADVAFAAGFTSVRQFNDTIREVFALTPTALRADGRKRGRLEAPGTIALRLPYRAPLAAPELFRFLTARAVPGVEAGDGESFRRTLTLPYGSGIVGLRPADGHIRCTLRLDDLRDLGAAVERCRRLLDLDADPAAVDEQLGADELLAASVAARPGLRSPGHVDAAELAVRAVVGQQVSVAGARTVTGRLVRRFGEPLAAPVDGLTHRFPTSDALADADSELLSMPGARARSLAGLARALAGGDLSLDAGADRADVALRLAKLGGIGPWTIAYIQLRGLGDPDVFMPTDLGIRRALERLAVAGDPRDIEALANRWKPWRSYALHHLWALLNASGPVAPTTNLAKGHDDDRDPLRTEPPRRPAPRR
jgi:AraC family transcriptional regulator of adaptative response / DNA-3-methyladenine glycosylase II